MPLDLPTIREQFPGLQRKAIFFDNPGGTQISQASLERMTAYLTECNANHAGAFTTSRASDEILDLARSSVAAFVNASLSEEIVFGPNMTSLTFNLSRSLAHWMEPNDHVVVTHLDHDANIRPWLLIAEERGCKVLWVDFDVESGKLDLDSYHAALESKPKLVAVGYASNALGTINPLPRLVKDAQEVGALVYVDAVQYAPHCPLDVQNLGCDFLVCSAYKFFGPHIAFLYGRYDLLAELKAYKVRPAPDNPPWKFETGTQNHEGIAGLLGAIEYLEWIGTSFGDVYREKYSQRYEGKHLHLKQAMAAIRAYEFEISTAILQVLNSVPGLVIYGPNDPRHAEERVPTFSFTMKDWHPRQLAEALNEKRIYVWDGNYYALAVTERLGLEKQGGMVRVGAVHYNTLEEVEQLGHALKSLTT
ncbi:MAG: cysteine desulfurase-like protein [Chloroflexota bacterium]